jgi:hypothetical protein
MSLPLPLLAAFLPSGLSGVITCRQSDGLDGLNPLTVLVADSHAAPSALARQR